MNSSTEQSSDAMCVSLGVIPHVILIIQRPFQYSVLVTSLGMIQPGIVAKGTVLRGVLCAVLLKTYSL